MSKFLVKLGRDLTHESEFFITADNQTDAEEAARRIAESCEIGDTETMEQEFGISIDWSLENENIEPVEVVEVPD